MQNPGTLPEFLVKRADNWLIKSRNIKDDTLFMFNCKSTY